MSHLVIYNLLNNVSMKLQFVFNDYIKSHISFNY